MFMYVHLVAPLRRSWFLRRDFDPLDASQCVLSIVQNCLFLQRERIVTKVSGAPGVRATAVPAATDGTRVEGST